MEYLYARLARPTKLTSKRSEDMLRKYFLLKVRIYKLLISNADLSQHYNSRQVFSEEEEQLLVKYFLTCAELKP